MIKVNNREFEWQQGLTVESLLNKIKATGDFDFILTSTITVIINKRIIQQEIYGTRLILDGEDIRLYPYIVGG